MKSSYDFYEGADFIGSKNEVISVLQSITDIENMKIVRKSERRWAVFSGQSCFIIPEWEMPMDALAWLKLME
ncbi:MAG: hypothetical protein Q8Q03_03120 [bacterium]|nr:hypothetical protein [bacterium]